MGGGRVAMREGVASLEVVLEQQEIFRLCFYFLSLNKAGSGSACMHECTRRCRHSAILYVAVLVYLSVHFPCGICVFHASGDGGG